MCKFFRNNGLSLVLTSLFLISFAIHASGGLIEENEKRMEQDRPLETMGEFLTKSQFWFESFQNWQSEFLAVLCTLIIASALFALFSSSCGTVRGVGNDVSGVGRGIRNAAS